MEALAGGRLVDAARDRPAARGERSYNQPDVLLRPLLAAGPTRLVEEFRRAACQV